MATSREYINSVQATYMSSLSPRKMDGGGGGGVEGWSAQGRIQDFSYGGVYL